jgi:ParB-like chromosome segregation protein Spo0J
MAAAPKVAFRRAEELRPDPRNARTHPPEQLDMIEASIERFGFTNPVIASGDDLVAGHGRQTVVLRMYAAGKSIRLPNGQPVPAGMIPALDASGWSEEDRRAYLLADNQLALQAGWDDAILRAELDALAAADFDLSTIGFDEAALAALAEPEPEPEADRTAPDQFPEFGEDIETQHKCPKCGYAWSGKSS